MGTIAKKPLKTVKMKATCTVLCMSPHPPRLFFVYRKRLNFRYAVQSNLYTSTKKRAGIFAIPGFQTSRVTATPEVVPIQDRKEVNHFG